MKGLIFLVALSWFVSLVALGYSLASLVQLR
jgi:hypothetical protein